MRVQRWIFACFFLVLSVGSITSPLCAQQSGSGDEEPYLINFNNVQIEEVLRFLTRITGKNFVWLGDEDLDFRVTIISEEATSADNVMAALLQVLRVRGLLMIEQGNNILIHSNESARRPPRLADEENQGGIDRESEMQTRVYRLINVESSLVASLIQAMLSDQALVETVSPTNHLVVTDLATNVERVTEIIERLDSSRPTHEIGQYLVRNSSLSGLARLAESVMEPIAGDQILELITHEESNSIFIVSTPYLVEKTISVLQTFDLTSRQTRILSLDSLEVIPESPVEVEQPSVAQPTEEERVSVQTIQERIRLIEVPLEVDPTAEEPVAAFEPERRAAEQELQQELAVETGRLQKSLQTEGLSVEEQEYLQERLELIEQMLSTSQDRESQLTELEDRREGLKFRQRQIEVQLMSPDLSDSDRERLNRELFEIREQIAQLEEQSRQVDRGLGERLTILSARLQQLIDNPPPPPVLDIRTDTRVIGGTPTFETELPDVLRQTQYRIFKLKHRSADDVINGFSAIADAMATGGDPNSQLLEGVLSAKAIEATNSIVVTATPAIMDEIEAIIEDLDVPNRQVFIEMLILETSVNKSLEFGVQWGGQVIAGNNVGASTGFFTAGSPLPGAIGELANNNIELGSITNTTGGHLGIVGKVLTWGNNNFANLGGLVKALQTDGESNIIMNPKIIAEDRVPAEVFVGINTRFRTQTITNDEGSVLSVNFEYRDVGSTLSVTPFLGDGDIITLEIDQNLSGESGEDTEESEEEIGLGPVTTVARTRTRVHVPDKHFLVLSGMIREERTKSKSALPCLGSIPILGVAFGSDTSANAQSNIMIFVRPQLIDTADHINELTKRQYGKFQKTRIPKPTERFEYEIDTGLDFLNDIDDFDQNAFLID